jgi:site-specific recombinase XerD
MAAKKANINVQEGLLFPKLKIDGSVSDKRWSAKAMNPILKRDLLGCGLYEGETPHSFRHGGTCDSLKEGKSLQETMYLAYMKNTSTAQIYSRGIQILFPRGFSWSDLGIDSSSVSVAELSKEMKSWSAFN